MDKIQASIESIETQVWQMVRRLRAIGEYNRRLGGGDPTITAILAGDEIIITDVLGENPDGSPASLSGFDDEEVENG